MPDRPMLGRRGSRPSARAIAVDALHREPVGRSLDAPVRTVVRYRGFVLIPQEDLSWLVRPERSPMTMLPFRTPASSLPDVKGLIDWRLSRRSAAA